MVYTQHFCAKCGSADIRRNGHKDGHARYQCKACRHQARFVPAAIAQAARYEQAERLLSERNSQRSIVRATGVARMTLAKWIKKSGGRLAAPAPAAAEKGPSQALASVGTGRDVDVCGPQEAKGLAVAGR